MITRMSSFLPVCLMLTCLAIPIHAQQATTKCTYPFTSGAGDSYLSYCVTVNGNILDIQTPFGFVVIGSNGEGYGICNESPAQNYTDYAVSDTRNWKNAVLVSHTSTSVKIARTTADGNWTLTQTISLIPNTPSITLAMALKNNQSTAHVAYLVRFADAEFTNAEFWLGTHNSALARQNSTDTTYGLQLANVGVPPFSLWQGYAQNVNTGPNACAFAFNVASSFGGSLEDFDWIGSDPPGSIEMAYVGKIGAGQTKTVTLSYHGL